MYVCLYFSASIAVSGAVIKLELYSGGLLTRVACPCLNVFELVLVEEFPERLGPGPGTADMEGEAV